MSDLRDVEELKARGVHARAHARFPHEVDALPQRLFGRGSMPWSVHTIRELRALREACEALLASSSRT